MTNILLLKDTSGGKLMRGGGGEKQGTSAEKIMEGVDRAGHRFEMDSWTAGDGNCFPRAVRQQCQRRAVGINSITDHKDLRKKVTQYMLKSEDRVVVDMRRRWEELEVRWSWQSYWKRMSRDTEWVEESFIWATAWFLNRDIWIVWDTATPQSPLSFFSGDKGGNNSVCPGVPLLIGHHTDTHYQSLLPVGDPVDDSFDARGYAVEVNKTLERVRESHKRKSRPKRKEPPASASKEAESIILNYGPGKPGVEVKKIREGGVEYKCLLCKADQKQIASHMGKIHADMFENKELEEFQLSLKKFAKAVRDKTRETKMREEDLEGFLKAYRKRDSRRVEKRRLEDADEWNEANRKKQAKCVAKQNKENPKKHKKARKRWNKTQRDNGPKKYTGETKLGPVFPCACCRTNKFRHQVVLFNKEQAAKIDQKAEEIHQAIQVIYTFDTVLFAFLCVNCIYLIEFGKVRYLDI